MSSNYAVLPDLTRTSLARPGNPSGTPLLQSAPEIIFVPDDQSLGAAIDLERLRAISRITRDRLRWAIHGAPRTDRAHPQALGITGHNTNNH